MMDIWTQVLIKLLIRWILKDNSEIILLLPMLCPH